MRSVEPVSQLQEGDWRTFLTNPSSLGVFSNRQKWRMLPLQPTSGEVRITGVVSTQMMGKRTEAEARELGFWWNLLQYWTTIWTSAIHPYPASAQVPANLMLIPIWSVVLKKGNTSWGRQTLGVLPTAWQVCNLGRVSCPSRRKWYIWTSEKHDHIKFFPKLDMPSSQWDWHFPVMSRKLAFFLERLRLPNPTKTLGRQSNEPTLSSGGKTITKLSSSLCWAHKFSHCTNVDHLDFKQKTQIFAPPKLGSRGVCGKNTHEMVKLSSKWVPKSTFQVLLASSSEE